MIAQILRIDIAIEVGATTETVTVNANAPLLKTGSGELSHNVITDRIKDLPLSTGRRRYSKFLFSAKPASGGRTNTDILRFNGAPGHTADRSPRQEIRSAGCTLQFLNCFRRNLLRPGFTQSVPVSFRKCIRESADSAAAFFSRSSASSMTLPTSESLLRVLNFNEAEHAHRITNRGTELGRTTY
jgi:hypothetical protein